MGGKIRFKDRIRSKDSNWEYFVTSNRGPFHYLGLPADTSERNRDTFANIGEVEGGVITVIKELEVKGSLDSYHILGLQNINTVVNDMLSCKC